MKEFKFDENLDYQIEAIDSIVEIFSTGENMFSANESFTLQQEAQVESNKLDIDEQQILKNIQSIQKQNGIDPVDKLESRNFSVEMETGTGKTYVYLRTALELFKKYGLKKFIILVPSVAIREGVLKTFEQTESHFKRMYNVGYNYFPYDSGKLSEVRDFVQSIDIQFMVMTIDSFNKSSNIMRRTPDQFHGERPIDLVAETRPVVIMDEPQNMESEISKSSISDLDPLFKLRYSATHRNTYNLMYRLTPVDAYQKNLVKSIEVYGVEDYNPGTFVFEVQEIKTKKSESPKAKVLVEVQQAGDSYVRKEITLKHGDDLQRKTGNGMYEGLLVNEVNAAQGRVELSDGTYHVTEEDVGQNREAIFRAQIRKTIKTHFEKQEKVGDRLKVLSLFFIDKVANYTAEDGLIKRIFTEEFEKLKGNYERFTDTESGNVHDGYFAKRKSGDGYLVQEHAMKKNQEAFDLIMKDKEKLLSFEESISFIFSHSALGEGWDNPNVFQICTLNETRSKPKIRQEIGRGLRLPVDSDLDRITDEPDLSVLSVIANQSYKQFVAGLQEAYDEAGYESAPPSSDANKKVDVEFKKHLAIESEDFKKLWQKIRQRTRFNITVDTEELISKAITKINELGVSNLVIRIDHVSIGFDDEGEVKTVYENESAGERSSQKITVGNFIERVAKETGVTKETVHEIFSRVENLNLLLVNPEEYQRSVSVIIKSVLNDLLINEGLQYTPIDDVWEIELFEDFERSEKNTLESKKSVYNRVVFESDGEERFARNLEDSKRVNLFAKLPPKFVVDTPLGTYNPDWAIVLTEEDDTKLYLVRETKFLDDLKNLRPSEKKKIRCGRKHFNAIGVNFETATKEDLSDLL